MIKNLKIMLIALLVICIPQLTVAASQAKKSILAEGDGKGSVSIVWMPVDNKWPRGGWRLERISEGRTSVVAKQIGPGLNSDAMKRLTQQQADGIREFANKLKAGNLTAEESNKAGFAFSLATAVDQTFGEAIGLRYIDSGLGRGSVRYRLVALDASGRAAGSFESPAVDPWTEPPPVPALEGIKAEQTNDGVVLSWNKPAGNSKTRVVSYFIERNVPNGEPEALTQKPLLIATQTGKKKLSSVSHVDARPIVEKTVTYSVRGVDLFLRKSAPATVTIFVKDLSALASPENFAVRTKVDEVRLGWKANPSPHTSGYVLERSQLYDGPYETLNAEKLPRDTESFKDTPPRGGSTYYYRIHSVNRRGEMGPPSHALAARPENDEAPSRPDNLKISAGTSRIRLIWDAVQFPVAGYFIERRAEGAERWMRMNSRLSPETRYDDHFGEQNGAKFRYRVIAVAFDNKESKPSSEAEIILPDNLPPATPYITDLGGKGGKVSMRFQPAMPQEDTYRFAVLRSDSPKETGIVIGDLLSADARSYEDIFVEAGKDYWYRLVAFDKAGNRSQPTRPMVVHVGTPEIPKPRKPGVESVTVPFPHNRITYEPAPAGLRSIVQARQGEAGIWKNISGPVSDESQAADADPPEKVEMFYRVIYQAPNGAMGEPSAFVSITR